MNKKKRLFGFSVSAFGLAAACVMAACAGTESPVSPPVSASEGQNLDPQGSPEPGTIEPPAGEEGEAMSEYDFSVFTNVEITGTELSAFSEDQLAVLYQQARYCQAMTEADLDTMDEIVSDNSVFTHMSGRQQTKEEYFADVRDGSLRYFTIGIENPVVEVNGGLAAVTYTSVLNANAYGARGTYRMGGSHWFENRDGVWYSINNPENEKWIMSH